MQLRAQSLKFQIQNLQNVNFKLLKDTQLHIVKKTDFIVKISKDSQEKHSIIQKS